MDTTFLINYIPMSYKIYVILRNQNKDFHQMWFSVVYRRSLTKILEGKVKKLKKSR